MSGQHTSEEILSMLESVEVAVVATSAGDRVRCRMMHYAFDKNFNVYLTTMKGDPKTAQITHHPSIALLIHKGAPDINDSKEVEITGKAFMVRDEHERQRALEATAVRSPVVNYLVETGNARMLDCIKVVPETVKFRIFREIVQGKPPTVIEFPENRSVVSDWEMLKTKVTSWLVGLRVSFLTASIVPILLGTAIAWADTRAMHWGYFLLTLIAGLSLHAGINAINDYFDHKSGNDDINTEFVRPFSGGSRVIQLGLLTPLEVLIGGLLLVLLASLVGLYLAWTRGAFILALGAIGLLSGLFYTGHPFNWASRGVGEALVGLNFGLLMTLGTYYVQTQSLSWTPVVAALPLAFLISAVLWINEFPDYSADKAVGKKTLVVRLGRRKGVAGYAALVIGTYLSLLAGVLAGLLPAATLLGFIILPTLLRAIQYAKKHCRSSFDLVPANALTVIAHLATGLLLTLVYAWEGLGLQGLGYLAVLGAAFFAFVVYIYRHIEEQKNVFLALKQVVR